MDGGAWQATARGVSKCWTRLSDQHIHAFSELTLVISLSELPQGHPGGGQSWHPGCSGHRQLSPFGPGTTAKPFD